MLALLERFGIPIWALPLAAGVIAAAGAWYVTDAVWDRKWSKHLLADTQAELVATDKARAKDAENTRLASALDRANLEKKDALDKAADLARDLARTHGLWVKAKGIKCVPGATPNPVDSPDSASEVRLSDETSEWLISFATDADRAAIYAQTCHDWAMKIGRQ